jgi:hypothetical protein
MFTSIMESKAGNVQCCFYFRVDRILQTGLYLYSKNIILFQNALPVHYGFLKKEWRLPKHFKNLKFKIFNISKISNSINVWPFSYWPCYMREVLIMAEDGHYSRPRPLLSHILILLLTNFFTDTQKMTWNVSVKYSWLIFLSRLHEMWWVM